MWLSNQLWVGCSCISLKLEQDRFVIGQRKHREFENLILVATLYHVYIYKWSWLYTTSVGGVLGRADGRHGPLVQAPLVATAAHTAKGQADCADHPLHGRGRHSGRQEGHHQ